MSVDIQRGLQETMHDDDFVRAMLARIASFYEYRDKLPKRANGYTRSLLHANDAFEIVAMRWTSGSRSAIHDHGASRCWMVVLDGRLDVENFQRVDLGESTPTLRRSEALQLHSGDFDLRAGSRELHRVGNSAVDDAYSLQLYARPLSEYTTITDETSGRCIRSTATYDATLFA